MWLSRFFPGCNLTWSIFLVQAAVLSLCSCVNSILSLELPEIHWNSSNPMFKTSNNDHIVEVNIGDELDFVCPYYSQTSGVHEDEHEYYIIHRVTETEYRDCNIDAHNSPFAIINCNKPQEQLYFTLAFSPFLPTPNVPEFKSGGTYYFITTSTGDSTGLQNNYKGACYHDNMKLTIKVCCDTSTACLDTDTRGCCSCPTDNSSTTTSTTTTTTTTTERPTPYTRTPSPSPHTSRATKRVATVSPTPNKATSSPLPHTPRVRDTTTTTALASGTTDSNVEDTLSPTEPSRGSYVSTANRLSHTTTLFLYYNYCALVLLFTLKSFPWR